MPSVHLININVVQITNQTQVTYRLTAFPHDDVEVPHLELQVALRLVRNVGAHRLADDHVPRRRVGRVTMLLNTFSNVPLGAALLNDLNGHFRNIFDLKYGCNASIF